MKFFQACQTHFRRVFGTFSAQFGKKHDQQIYKTADDSSFSNLLSQPYQFPMSTYTFQSHLSVLESSVRSYPTRPAFRTPVVNKETSQISEWTTITYAQFHQDVQLYARYWASILSADGVTAGSIIGLWCVSRLVSLIDLHTLTPHSIRGLLAQHTPMCFTCTE